MLKKILFVLAAIVVLICLAASMQPDEFRVSREALIQAPPETVFPLVNNQKAWESWSPWKAMEPDAAMTFEGPEEGVGAISAWDGEKIGAGRSTITQSRPNGFVEYRLDFTKPFTSTNMSEFTLMPEGEGTRVTWSMYGHNNFLSKVMSLFMNCEGMVGEQFEIGLANLNQVAQRK